MSDEQQAQAPATDAQAQGAAETAAQTPTTQAQATPAVTVEDLQAQIARMEKALKEANKEEAARRKRLKELEDAEQARQQASLSEMDKLKAQIAEEKAAKERALADATTANVKSAIMAQASALGFANPEDAYLLIDMAAVTVADGNVKGITEGLQKLVKDKPYLLKARQAAPQVSPTNPGQNAGQGMTDDQLRVMIFGQTNRRGFTRAEAEKHGGGVIWNKRKEE